MLSIFAPWGEANPYQRELARALASLGVEVVPGRSAAYFPLLTAARASGSMPIILHLHWTHGFMVASSTFKTLVKGLRFLLELAVLKLRGVKLVWTVHNLLEHERRHPLLELMFTCIAVRFYDHLIVHSDYARKAVMNTYRLSRRFKEKITVIPHGHYLGCYENSISRSKARQRLGIGEDEIVFLYIGQIRPYKGVPHLLESFLKLDVPRIRLVVAGRPSTGQLKEEIERKAEKDPRVVLRLEFIPDDELQIYLNAADVVVLPYHDILTSGSAVLAMSFGRAVIAPRLGCVTEVIEEGKGGFLYDPADGDGLFKAMRKAIQEDLSAMGDYNLRKARELDWTRIAEATLEVYRRCLRQTG
ncbi:MAG: glycosyltransferase family 4 protein [Firmicutes bacterium]|nr:glycosyltransferase family 4 protein [Bacillota bacterium]